MGRRADELPPSAGRIAANAAAATATSIVFIASTAAVAAAATIATDDNLDGVAEGGGTGPAAANRTSALGGHDIPHQTPAAGAGRPLAVDPDRPLGDILVFSVAAATCTRNGGAVVIGQEADDDGRSRYHGR